MKRKCAALQSEINVTPLVDVVLVLLTIFMVIVPLTLRGFDVHVTGDAVAAAAPEPDHEQIVLSIAAAGCPVLAPPVSAGLPANCTVSINDEELPVRDLAERLGAIFTSRAPSERLLFLSVEERLNYEGVMRIVDTAGSGVSGLRIGLIAASEGEFGVEAPSTPR